MSGFALTEGGRAAHAERLAAWAADQPTGPLAKVYDAFLDHNSPLKSLCASWQQAGTDDAARFQAMGDLEDLHDQAAVVCDGRRADPALRPVRPPLGAAVDKVKGGDDRFFTSPLVDSYHTVWFEAHEDFLLSLGRDRAAEGSFDGCTGGAGLRRGRPRRRRGAAGWQGCGPGPPQSLGLPVPPGLIITTDVCHRFLADGGLPDDVWAAVLDRLARVEESLGRRLGDEETPLLLSVRSGAPGSMPGMMDTILDIGVCERTMPAIARISGDAFAWETYGRLVRMFGTTVTGIAGATFEAARLRADEDEQALAAAYLAVFADETGQALPAGPARPGA